MTEARGRRSGGARRRGVGLQQGVTDRPGRRSAARRKRFADAAPLLRSERPVPQRRGCGAEPDSRAPPAAPTRLASGMPPPPETEPQPPARRFIAADAPAVIPPPAPAPSATPIPAAPASYGATRRERSHRRQKNASPAARPVQSGAGVEASIS